MRKVPLLLLFLSVLTSVVNAQQNDVSRAAKDFAFHGVTLSTSIETFLRRYPKAALRNEGCDKSANVVIYGVMGEETGGATYSFVDGKLYEMDIIYDHEDLTRMGGYRVPLDKLVEKLGYASDGNEKDNSISATWDFPEVNRRIQCSEIGGTGCLIKVIDTQAAENVLRRKEKAANLGF